MPHLYIYRLLNNQKGKMTVSVVTIEKHLRKKQTRESMGKKSPSYASFS